MGATSTTPTPPSLTLTLATLRPALTPSSPATTALSTLDFSSLSIALATRSRTPRTLGRRALRLRRQMRSRRWEKDGNGVTEWMGTPLFFGIAHPFILFSFSFRHLYH